MKKKITFEKRIDFPTMIGEVCAISLEHNLKFVDESNVEGDLLLTGKYKLTEASRLEEDFSYKIPTEIALTEKIDLSTAKIDITDFYYEIENEDIMICNIELTLEGLEIIDIEEDHSSSAIEEVVRECDGDSALEKEIELPALEKEKKKEDMKEEKEQVKEKMEKDKEMIKKDIEKEEKSIVETTLEKEGKDLSVENDDLFINLSEAKETYGTFSVYIVRQNETINSILEKYNTTIEEVEKYNNIKDISIGTKLIIPILND